MFSGTDASQINTLQQTTAALSGDRTGFADLGTQINLQTVNENILLSVQAINNLGTILTSWFANPNNQP